MLDFGTLPPEINSGRMYVGAGSGPMLAAAAAWDSLAADLQSAASSYGSTVEGLVAGAWTGPSSMTMAAAASPFATWVSGAAAQAEEAAAQAKLAAGAYETAFAATVPPPVIAANRALLAMLVATNFLGQNTPAIAATETHYMEMWAQDAAAMYAYAGSSSAASQLTAFTEPPQTTNPAGTALQSAAVSQSSAASGLDVGTKLSQLINSVPTWLQNLSTTLGSTGQAGGAGNLLAGLRSAPDRQHCTVGAGQLDDRPRQLEHDHVHHCIRAVLTAGPDIHSGWSIPVVRAGIFLRPKRPGSGGVRGPESREWGAGSTHRRDAESGDRREHQPGFRSDGQVGPGWQHVGTAGLDRSRTDDDQNPGLGAARQPDCAPGGVAGR